MKTEICQNCGCTIGKLERAYVFNEKVVCQNCYQRLTDTKDKQVKTAIKNPIEVKAEAVLPQIKQKKSTHKVTKFIITVIVIVFIILSPYLVSHVPPQVFSYFTIIAKVPALSEKDAKLIEAFIHETNLLCAVRLTDEEAIRTQRIKFNAAYDDIGNFGSSDESMVKVSSLAFPVWFHYGLAYDYLEMGNLEEYKKFEEEASRDREKLVAIFRSFQGLESKQKDEATSE